MIKIICIAIALFSVVGCDSAEQTAKKEQEKAVRDFNNNMPMPSTDVHTGKSKY